MHQLQWSQQIWFQIDHVPSEGRPGAHPTLVGGGASYIFSVSQTSNNPKVGFYPILYNFLDSIRAKPGHQGADDSSRHPLSHPHNCFEGRFIITWELVPCRGCQPLGACLLGREELVLRPLLESLAARVAWADGLAAVYSHWDGGCDRLLTPLGRAGLTLFWLFFPSPGLLLLLLCGLRAGKCRRCSCWSLPSPSVLSSEDRGV